MIELPRLAPRLLESRLENGLRLVLLPDRSSSLVAINLWYHVGSKEDPAGRTGLAHLFEHMLFQGSQHVAANEHFQLVQQVGGATNASTSYDRTNYYETLPAHCLELGLWLESDRMGYLLPALTREKFEGQRSVVINERRQRIENQPYGRAFETVHAALYPNGHPYGWPIIGRMEDIEAAELVDVEQFFSTYYSPANAVLSLAGDFEPRRNEALVRHYFGELPSPAGNPPRALISESQTRSAGGEQILLEDEVALARVYLAWRAPSLTTPTRYAGEILAAALASGKSSPLYQDLVHQKQLAQDVTAFLLPLELGSTFLVVATARPGVPLSRIEQRLDDHLERAARRPPRPGDLERARNQVVKGFLDQMQSVESLADLLSYATTLFGSPLEVEGELGRYLSAGSEEMAAFAHEFLDPNTALRIRVVPRQSRGGAS